ncbi:MAG: hypothetical protein ACKV0T_07850 [Planctomycetales bacterium]
MSWHIGKNLEWKGYTPRLCAGGIALFCALLWGLPVQGGIIRGAKEAKKPGESATTPEDDVLDGTAPRQRPKRVKSRKTRKTYEIDSLNPGNNGREEVDVNSAEKAQQRLIPETAPKSPEEVAAALTELVPIGNQKDKYVQGEEPSDRRAEEEKKNRAFRRAEELKRANSRLTLLILVEVGCGLLLFLIGWFLVARRRRARHRRGDANIVPMRPRLDEPVAAGVPEAESPPAA